MKAVALVLALSALATAPVIAADPSDWKTGKLVEEINKLKAAGGLVDLMPASDRHNRTAQSELAG